MKGEYNGTGVLRDRLREMLTLEIAKKAKHGRSEELYQSPNWELQQADMNGFIRGLEHVISLIK